MLKSSNQFQAQLEKASRQLPAGLFFFFNYGYKHLKEEKIIITNIYGE